ncbi:MAG: chemotaxis protein, partial [Thiomonas sp.]
MKRTPQRSLLLFWLVALLWGGGMVELAWTSAAQPLLLLTAWAGGAVLLLLLALYLGLSFRLDLFQVQQALREASMDPHAEGQGKSALAAVWWPLIDAVAAQRQPQHRSVEDCDRYKTQIDALQAALAAERAEASAWQHQAVQAQAELGLLQRQVHDAAQTLVSMESALAAATLRPDMLPDTTQVGEDQLHQQLEALAAVAALLATLTSEFEMHVGASAQQEAAARAHALARAARQTQDVAALQQGARQLAQAVDDLQLLGLNLRLHLSHLAGVTCADPTLFE